MRNNISSSLVILHLLHYHTNHTISYEGYETPEKKMGKTYLPVQEHTLYKHCIEEVGSAMCDFYIFEIYKMEYAIKRW